MGMRNAGRRVESTLTEGLSHDDLSLLEVLVRIHAEATRSPEIQARLAELGTRLGRAAASEVRPRLASRSGR